MKKKRIGLFGLGTVGQAFYDLVSKNHSDQWDIVRICVRDKGKPREVPQALLTWSREDILSDLSLDIVVELISDHSEAFDIARRVLSQGRHLVTANKRMLANHLSEIRVLTYQYGGKISYEASACGSIPIVGLLQTYYRPHHIKRLSGIFNGTTNYILTRMAEEGISYHEALANATSLGFAEADPTMDVEGFDAKFKLILLSYLASGVIVHPGDVLNVGISSLSAADFTFAERLNAGIKLLASFEQNDLGCSLRVLPMLVPFGGSLNHVRLELNAAEVITETGGTHFLSGPGAGGNATATAVISDVDATFSLNVVPHSRTPHTGDALALQEVEVYLRHRVGDLRFHVPELVVVAEDASEVQRIGKVSERQLSQWNSKKDKSWSVVALGQLASKVWAKIGKESQQAVFVA